MKKINLLSKAKNKVTILKEANQESENIISHKALLLSKGGKENSDYRTFSAALKKQIEEIDKVKQKLQC